MKKYIKTFTVVFLSILVCSCHKKELEDVNTMVHVNENKSLSKIKTINTLEFDWENIDEMPTPEGQKILVPWVGQGTINGAYDPDVVMDRKKSDGWELVYNTFDPNEVDYLKNPYFILYNKYRGIMRIFLYVTQDFVTTSTYIRDGFTTNSAGVSPILNFMGNDIVDISVSKTHFTQVHPGSLSGAAPLAANKWYMMQYEIAYDPNIAKIYYAQLPLNWEVNYCDVHQFKFDGSITGTLKSAVASSEDQFFSAANSLGKVAGTIALTGLGKNLFFKGGDLSNNVLGLPDKIFNAASKGLDGAMKSSTAKLPGTIFNFFSAILGGSSGGPTISLVLNADIEMNGIGTSQGAFPSSPTTIFVPGSDGVKNCIGYSPLIEEKLGVFNLTTKPKSTINCLTRFIYPQGVLRAIISDYNFENNLDAATIVYNDDVTKIANIELVKRDFVVFSNEDPAKKVIKHDGTEEYIGKYGMVYVNPKHIQVNDYVEFNTAVRYTFKVTPNDPNAAISKIVKTFYTDRTLNRKVVHIGGPL